MKILKLIFSILNTTSFLFLFFIMLLQGMRIERLEKDVVNAEYDIYHLKTENKALKGEIKEYQEKCKRVTDQAVDFVMSGGWK